MGAPGAFRDVPLMMGRKVALLADKTKRGLFCHPGKPLRGIRLKWEYPPFWTDDHIASLVAILDPRDDMHRLAGRLGRGSSSRTSVGNWGGWFGWLPCHFGRLGRSERPGGLLKLRREQGGELSHRGAQGSDLGLQSAERLWQRKQGCRQRRQRVGNALRWPRWQGSQAALMQVGQQVQMLAAHPFFAAIVGMAL